MFDLKMANLSEDIEYQQIQLLAVNKCNSMLASNTTHRSQQILYQNDMYDIIVANLSEDIESYDSTKLCDHRE